MGIGIGIAKDGDRPAQIQLQTPGILRTGSIFGWRLSLWSLSPIPWALTVIEVAVSVRVETIEGRSEYQRRQRELSARAAVLRAALIALVGGVLSP